MIRLNDFGLVLGTKEIFKETIFEAHQNQLTLIKGESGSGKTSLLKCLDLDQKFNGQYIYNDLEISKLNNNDKNKYKQSHICMVDQFPVFINELTIESHYQLFAKDYIRYDQLNTIELLKINQLMKEYPHQLSEGEKKRIAISLALIRNTDILLIDEPTSSLDDELSNEIGRMLKSYAHNGHIVIITSHDFILNEYADKVYNIDYLKLNIVTQSQATNRLLCNHKRRNINFWNNNYIKMLKHRMKYKKLNFILTTLLISIIGLSSIFNNAVISFHKNIINNLSSKQIVVYKSNNKQLFDYSYKGFEYPITSEEVDALKSINHVESMHWKYDSFMINCLNENGDFSKIPDEVKETNEIMKIYDQDHIISSGIKDYQNVIPNMIMSSIDDSDNEKIEFRSKRNKKGIYLSKYLAEKISDNIDELIDKTIEIPIFVPVLDLDGVSFQSTEGGEEFGGNAVGAKRVIIPLPIVGILESSSVYETDEDSGVLYRYFVSQSIIEEYRDEYKKTESYFEYYAIINDKMEKYINSIPEDKKEFITQTVKCTPWQPNCYLIEIDDLTNLSEVINKINEIGLNAKHIYLNARSLQESVQNMNRSIKIVGACLLILLLTTQYNYKKQKTVIEEKEMIYYLERMGESDSQIRQICIKKYLYNSVFYIIVCSICIIIETFILNAFMYGHTKMSIYSFMIVVIIVVVLEFIYPIIIKRRKE
ncbi:ATP-binding cassette domain-containing protein [Candidatus Stoquefichus massiliensis]|uniref:ATP-binding cassette domain-containing protein n=1 Tax=Candidatus Stoquefichus massiliensis TaxID=1470350 RepID=UPI000483E236|nr:ATP-binding cassette domain-containing protein [Candidatus Stoquefichus massiliensis]